MHGANSANTPMDLTPMGSQQAAQLADRYLAGFPYLSLSDPEGYQSALVDVLQKYPMWAGEFVIQKGNDENPNLPVSAIQLRKWLEDAVRVHRNAAQWNEDSKKQIEGRKLLADERPKQTEEEFWREMEARGLRRPDRPQTPVEFTADLVKQKYGISDADWDAIPNQPVDSSYWRGVRFNK